MSGIDRTYTDVKDKQTGGTRICLFENGELKGSFNIGSLGVNIKTGYSTPEQKKANEEATNDFNQKIKNWIDAGVLPKEIKP